jgi:AraC family transcriptional regulator of adaptative response/methylated-DNA-[protein]-cysteine methyltransferase
MLDPARCWEAVRRRDAAEDGRFVFGVVTTGVYCRPSCRSRRPLRRNVRFFRTPEEAEAVGLRPCKRCRPQGAGAGDAALARIRDLAGAIAAEPDGDHSLAALSARVRMSPSHLQRKFRELLGLTPREFVEACRLRAVKKELRSQCGVLEAIFAAGFGSVSRVYERVDSRLGMTPAEYRGGGAGLDITHVHFESPLGLLMLGATARGLCFVQFGHSEAALLEELHREYPRARLVAAEAPYSNGLTAWMGALNEHLRGHRVSIDLPLDVQATAFQMSVWRYLQSIPRGEVRTYSQVALALGRPRSARAVASACARNRVALVIPCHRVIRGDGGLGGYRWGLDRKQALLSQEAANTATRAPGVASNAS